MSAPKNILFHAKVIETKQEHQRHPRPVRCISNEDLRGEGFSQWRSSGWVPLAYPSVALTGTSPSDGNENAFFPLNEDVMCAAIRELLLIQKSIDRKNLTLLKRSDAQVKHQAKKRKSKHSLSAVAPPAKKKGGHYDVTRNSPHASTDFVVLEEEGSDTSVSPIQTAEDLCNWILQSAVGRSEPVKLNDIADTRIASAVSALLDKNDNAERPLESIPLRRPRKVSDADSMDTSLEITSSNDADITNYISLSRWNNVGILRRTRADLPPLLRVSILAEKKLRDVSNHLTTAMAAPFNDESLRTFFGYKSPALKRTYLIRVLSDYLFDVSHAVFAWEQTERELRASGFDQDEASLSKAVCKSLFDERALKKIGGTEPSSLLSHALSIGRLRNERVSWADFARTGKGKKMLKHHANGTIIDVGQRRRGHRVKHNVQSHSEELVNGRRSRSSSVTSSDASDERSTRISVPSDEQIRGGVDPANGTAAESPFLATMPELVMVTMRKEDGESWGVKLAKEGDLCVVDSARVRKDKPVELQLRRGDMILHAENEDGSVVQLPGSTVGTRLTDVVSAQWFQDLISLFKSSNVLHVTVRRVQCA